MVLGLFHNVHILLIIASLHHRLSPYGVSSPRDDVRERDRIGLACAIVRAAGLGNAIRRKLSVRRYT